MLNIKSLIAATVLSSVAAVSFAAAPTTATAPVTPAVAVAPGATAPSPDKTVAKANTKRVKHVKAHKAAKTDKDVATKPATPAKM